ncbi:MAG: ATP-binding protein [Anaerolineaceae bacterium]|nr:ATP-binding protein [Anaerolineaceae bacterium]
MIFRRKIYDKLLEWKNEKDGTTALLIEGARRVGKSTIAEEFAKKEYERYILIDFSVVSEQIIHLFDDLSDLNYIFLQLQLQFHVDLIERKSLIIFDEIQFCPKARQAIKTLVKDHRYDYLETGSLISIRKNVQSILIPSEEDRITMYPMDYEEFLNACGDHVSIPILKNFFDEQRALGDQTNRKMMRNFRLYMLVGGMPQAVVEYLRTNNLRKVDDVKRGILKLYDDDFRKIDNTGRISMLFDGIPAQLNHNASRYKIKSVFPNEYVERVMPLIAELESSKTILLAHHVNDPNVGLSSNIDLEKFKMFVCDTGLFVTLMFKDRDFTENVIYEKILNDKLSANLGYVYENVIAQTIASNDIRLFYYTFANRVSKHNYEIDFLLSCGNKICPLEIKSSGYKAHKSLDMFFEKYSDRIQNRYLIYTKDLRKEQDILCLPMYMAQFL